MTTFIMGLVLGSVAFAAGWIVAAWRYDNIHRDAMLAEVDKMGHRLDELCKEAIKKDPDPQPLPPLQEERTLERALQEVLPPSCRDVIGLQWVEPPRNMTPEETRLTTERHGLPVELRFGVTPSQEEAIMRRAISNEKWLLEREQRRAQQEALDRNRAREKQMMMDVKLRAPVPIKGVLVDGKVYEDRLSIPNKETES